MVTGGHRSVACLVICKIMIVIGIVYKQRMLTIDDIMEKPFVNSAIKDLYNGQIVIFTS